MMIYAFATLCRQLLYYTFETRYSVFSCFLYCSILANNMCLYTTLSIMNSVMRLVQLVMTGLDILIDLVCFILVIILRSWDSISIVYRCQYNYWNIILEISNSVNSDVVFD